MMTRTFTLVLFIAIAIAKPVTIHAQAANVNDSLALVDLYNSTNGPNWGENEGWLYWSVKNWYGITLDSNGRVINIALGGNALIGGIPSSLGNISNLQALDLGGNGRLIGGHTYVLGQSYQPTIIRFA